MLRAVCLLLMLICSSAFAEPLPALKPSERWLTVASAPDINTAKGIAQHYVGSGARIVSSDSGFYAVVLGPYRNKSIRTIQKRNGIGDLPKDALLSRGLKYKEVVWREDPASVGQSPLSPYSMSEPLHLSANSLSVKVSVLPSKEDPLLGGATVIEGTRDGKLAFRFEVGDDALMEAGSDAGFVQLDSTSDEPQLVITRYSGGTHCCTSFWFITRPKGSAGYTLLSGATLDGSGYQFRDLEGDGAMEMISIDNRFLYAFDSYAGSFAPLEATRLRGATLEDITQDDVAKDLRAENFGFIDFAPSIAPDTWQTNGFLAAWVAVKIRAGQGEDAWRTMLENHDRNSQFGPMSCLTGQSIEQCPPDQMKPIEFPRALANFLRDAGYTPLPQSAEMLLQ